MKIDIKHIAKLANLPFSTEEEEKYSEQLSKILDYVEQLDSVDTSSIEPTFNVTGLNNVMAEDEIRDCTLPSKGGMYVTKGVFEQ